MLAALKNIDFTHWNRWFILDYKTMLFATFVFGIFWVFQGLLYSAIEDTSIEYSGACGVEWVDEDGDTTGVAICGEDRINLSKAHTIELLRDDLATVSCELAVGEYFGGRTWTCDVTSPNDPIEEPSEDA